MLFVLLRARPQSLHMQIVITSFLGHSLLMFAQEML